ncbi:MAG TPA: YggT family protein [Candidatus Saccharimonadales bacterium]|nr:YggT family protein [Candidatus Saccharimonadales bacterium]
MKGKDVMMAPGASLAALFVSVAELGLAVRFVLHFFAVDPTNGFAAWINNSTDALLTPFRSVFTSAPVGHPHYVDLSLLFVMAAYALVVGALVAYLNPARWAKK